MEPQGGPGPRRGRGDQRRGSCWMAVLLLLLAHPLAAAASAGGTPIDSSVVLVFASDVDGGDGSQCAQMVRRALAAGGSSVNFFVTGYYRADGAGRLSELGYKASERDRDFRPFTWEAARRLATGLTGCMRTAVAAGAALAVHVHLDDGDDAGTWRNGLDFEPYTRYGDLSYWEALVRPAAEALRDANLRRAPARFAPQAEMGATVFHYPRAWRKMGEELRSLVAEGGTPPSAVRVGLNFNWEKVCGCPSTLLESTNYYNDLRARWWEVRAAVSTADVQALFRSVDWVGVSAYAPLPERPAPSDLEASLARTDAELRLFGIDFRRLGKDLVYSEYGIGGGETADYRTPARSPAAAAAAPYWGVAGRYDPARDPWASAANREFRRRFYNATIRFAADGGGPAYKVAAIYLWSIISFDVTGVHYMSAPRSSGSDSGSSGGNGSGEGYRDPEIVAAIRAHNAAVRGSERKQEKPKPQQQAPPSPPPPQQQQQLLPPPPPQQQQQGVPQPTGLFGAAQAPGGAPR